MTPSAPNDGEGHIGLHRFDQVVQSLVRQDSTDEHYLAPFGWLTRRAEGIDVRSAKNRMSGGHRRVPGVPAAELADVQMPVEEGLDVRKPVETISVPAQVRSEEPPTRDPCPQDRHRPHERVRLMDMHDFRGTQLAEKRRRERVEAQAAIGKPVCAGPSLYSLMHRFAGRQPNETSRVGTRRAIALSQLERIALSSAKDILPTEERRHQVDYARGSAERSSSGRPHR